MFSPLQWLKHFAHQTYSLSPSNLFAVAIMPDFSLNFQCEEKAECFCYQCDNCGAVCEAVLGPMTNNGDMLEQLGLCRSNQKKYWCPMCCEGKSGIKPPSGGFAKYRRHWLRKETPSSVWIKWFYVRDFPEDTGKWLNREAWNRRQWQKSAQSKGKDKGKGKGKGEDEGHGNATGNADNASAAAADTGHGNAAGIADNASAAAAGSAAQTQTPGLQQAQTQMGTIETMGTMETNFDTLSTQMGTNVEEVKARTMQIDVLEVKTQMGTIETNFNKLSTQMGTKVEEVKAQTVTMQIDVLEVMTQMRTIATDVKEIKAQMDTIAIDVKEVKTTHLAFIETVQKSMEKMQKSIDELNCTGQELRQGIEEQMGWECVENNQKDGENDKRRATVCLHLVGHGAASAIKDEKDAARENGKKDCEHEHGEKDCEHEEKNGSEKDDEAKQDCEHEHGKKDCEHEGMNGNEKDCETNEKDGKEDNGE